MASIEIETLDALIDRATKLKALLTDSPELLEFARLLQAGEGTPLVVPQVSDRLVSATQAAALLKVSKSTIVKCARMGKLRAFFTPYSNTPKYWYRDVVGLVREFERGL